MTTSKWYRVYLIAGFLGGVAGSMYYTYSRVYLRESLGAESNYVVGLMVSFEQIPSILGLLGGFLADAFGRRRIYSFSFIDPFLIALLAVINPFYFPFIALTRSLLGSITGPAITGALMTAVNRSGRLYSIYVSSSTFGWVIGGVVPGLIIGFTGSTGIFILVALITAVTILIQYLFFPETSIEKPKFGELPGVFRSIWDIVLANTLANGALSIFWTLIGLEIYSETRNLLLYGLLLSSITALAGGVVRPISGLLVDKYQPFIILLLSLASYLAIDTAIIFTRGVPRIILWIIPVYPFRDTATSIMISRRVSLKHQSTAFGLSTTMNTLSGIIVYTMNEVAKGDLTLIYIIHIAILLTAITILLTNYRLKQ